MIRLCAAERVNQEKEKNKYEETFTCLIRNIKDVSFQESVIIAAKFFLRMRACKSRRGL